MESPASAVFLLSLVVSVYSQYYSPGYGAYPGYGGESPSQEGGGMYGSPYQPYMPPPRALGPYGAHNPYGAYNPYGAGSGGESNAPEPGEGPSHGSPYSDPYGSSLYQQPGYYPPQSVYPPSNPYAGAQEAPEQPSQPMYAPQSYAPPPPPPPRPRSRLLPQSRPSLSMAIDGAGALPLKSPPIGVWSPASPQGIPLQDATAAASRAPTGARQTQAVDRYSPNVASPPPPAGARRGSVMTVQPPRPRTSRVSTPECGAIAEPGVCCAPPLVCTRGAQVEDETSNCTYHNKDATCCREGECLPARRRPFGRRRRPAAAGRPRGRPAGQRAPVRGPGAMMGLV